MVLFRLLAHRRTMRSRCLRFMDVVMRETPVEAIEACKQGNAEGNGDVEPLMLFGGLELTFVWHTLHETNVEPASERGGTNRP